MATTLLQCAKSSEFPLLTSLLFIPSLSLSLPAPTEHLGLALALSVPVFVVVTKIDMCPANVLQDTLRLLNRVLKSPGCRKIPVMVQSHDDVITSAVNFTSERYIHTSNAVTSLTRMMKIVQQVGL